jgi:hypothetical protein
VTDTAAPTLSLPGRVIQALLAGEQIVDLRSRSDAGSRKGGAPPAGATRFWLVADPGADPELKPAYQRAREMSLPDEGAGPGQVRIDGWAELAGTGAIVLDGKARDALNGKTILALEPMAGHEVLVLALRARRLVEPLTVSDDLAGLPADPAAGPPSEPAMSDMAFEARYNGLNGSLPGGLSTG